MEKYIRFIERSPDGYVFSLKIEDEHFDIYPAETMIEFRRVGAEYEETNKMYCMDEITGSFDNYYFLSYANLKSTDFEETILELKQKGWEF